jgi:hypothetical protein
MRMDFKEFYDLLSEPERRAFEGKLLARIQAQLEWCDGRARACKEKWGQSIEQDLDALGGDEARRLFLDASTRSYERWKNCERERDDLIAVLLAIGAEGTPESRFFEWKLGEIETIVASRRERKRQRYRQIHGYPEDHAGPAMTQPGEDNPPNMPPGRRRGARATTRPIVVAGIRKGIESGRYTIEQLKNREVTQDSLAAEFHCSRSPVKAALDEILGNGEAAGPGS